MSINEAQTQAVLNLAKSYARMYRESTIKEIATNLEIHTGIIKVFKNTYDDNADKTLNHIRCGEEAKEAIETFAMAFYYLNKLLDLQK